MSKTEPSYEIENVYFREAVRLPGGNRSTTRTWHRGTHGAHTKVVASQSGSVTLTSESVRVLVPAHNVAAIEECAKISAS